MHPAKDQITGVKCERCGHLADEHIGGAVYSMMSRNARDGFGPGPYCRCREFVAARQEVNPSNVPQDTPDPDEGIDHERDDGTMDPNPETWYREAQ